MDHRLVIYNADSWFFAAPVQNPSAGHGKQATIIPSHRLFPIILEDPISHVKTNFHYQRRLYTVYVCAPIHFSHLRSRLKIWMADCWIYYSSTSTSTLPNSIPSSGHSGNHMTTTWTTRPRDIPNRWCPVRFSNSAVKHECGYVFQSILIQICGKSIRIGIPVIPWPEWWEADVLNTYNVVTLIDLNACMQWLPVYITRKVQ